MSKKAIVIHSGGMDSSICLALAKKEFGNKEILSLSFNYHQRHSEELKRAQKICRDWQIEHKILNINYLKEITQNSLTDHSKVINNNTLVEGRNGLMARLGGIQANQLGANMIYMGIIEVEEWNSGYRDCSRDYMDLMQTILRIDFANPYFEIRTPLVKMRKDETLEIAQQLGVLEYLLEETITCYRGIDKLGCQDCPACDLRNEGIKKFQESHPEVHIPI